MSGPKTALQLVERATPARPFRLPSDRRPGRIDGPALARRRREHRRGYAARNRGERFQEWLGTALCLGAIVLVIAVVIGAFAPKAWF